VIIPEGLIEAVPGIQELIAELNELVAGSSDLLDSFNFEQKRDFVAGHLAAENAKLFASFPHYIEEMLLLERDSHGNLQVSQIPTENLIIDMVKTKVMEIDRSIPFQTQHHFFGYEGRCGAPSLFDATYTYHLGLIAGSLILGGYTGYICAFTDLQSGGRALALPLTGLLTVERRHGEDELVIEKALVEMDSPAFKYFESRRESWADHDLFSSPGPRQMWGPTAKQIPVSVALNQNYDDLIFEI
jgi:pyrophosphate--fructose-6-phosphate 1-phosphotransferase